MQVSQQKHANSFFHCVAKITRLCDYQTWQDILLGKFKRCAKVYGLSSLDCAFQLGREGVLYLSIQRLKFSFFVEFLNFH